MLNASKRLIVFIGVVVLLIVGVFVGAGTARGRSLTGAETSDALIVLEEGADFSGAIEAFEAAGGRVKHVFPPAALIGTLPTDTEVPAGVRAIYRQAISASALETLRGSTRRAARTWNALRSARAREQTEGVSAESLATLESELMDDAFVAPAPLTSLATADDPTPGYDETSEYFIGRVAVGLILPESDGSVDASAEDWTAEERALVRDEITAALDWWADLEPRADLTFVYDDGTASPIPTGYEPVGRPYQDQSLWIAEVMRKKGYTAASYFDQVRQYNQDLRQTYDTDWAFTIFVVDSSNDADNRFANDYFAYAYLGGPFTVMTSGSNGYGAHNLEAVAAHEVGHIFFALDQYYAARQACTARSGYLGVENQNSEYGDCALDEPSIMRGQVSPYRDAVIDEYARGQLGWRDSDGDGIFDPVDTPLSVTDVEVMTDTTRSNVLSVSGRVTETPYPSALRRDTIINRITQVQYRVAGGDWIDAAPVDDAFDAYTEPFTFTTTPLPTGDWAVELRVRDSAGNALTETLATVSVVDPADGIIDTTLERLAQEAGGQSLDQIVYGGEGVSTDGCIEAVYYRIDDGGWQLAAPEDGVFDDPEEPFMFTVDVDALGPGVHDVEAYSVDDEGNVETTPANDSIHVASETRCVFLPLVIAE